MPKIWIDNKRLIVNGNDEWDQLALHNKAVHLKYDQLLGTSYLHYIKGDAVRMMIDAVISRVIVTGKPYILSYRCDTPTLAQYMRMKIAKEKENMLSIDHELTGRKEISPGIKFYENEAASDPRCAVCGKVHFKGYWYDALTNRKVFGDLTELKTKSVVCGECESRLDKELEELAEI